MEGRFARRGRHPRDGRGGWRILRGKVVSQARADCVRVGCCTRAARLADAGHVRRAPRGPRRRAV